MSEDSTAELLERELQEQRQKLKEQKTAEKRRKRARNRTERAKKRLEKSQAREAARAAAPGRMVIVLNGRPVEAKVVQRPDTIVGRPRVPSVRTGAVQARPQVYRPSPLPPSTDNINMPRASRNIDGLPRVGDVIETPRFLRVEVSEVFPSIRAMREAGYTEPCHMWDYPFECYGRHTDRYGMVFAVAPRDPPMRSSQNLDPVRPSRNKAPAKGTGAKAKPATVSKKNTQGKKSTKSAPPKKPAAKR